MADAYAQEGSAAAAITPLAHGGVIWRRLLMRGMARIAGRSELVDRDAR